MSAGQKQRRSSQLHYGHITPQVRLLAPKGKGLPETPVHHRQTLGHYNIHDQQPIKGADPATQSSGHDFTPSPLLQPGHTFEQAQHSAVAPSTSIYSNRGPSNSAYAGFPELATGNLVSGLDTHESVGFSTQNLLYGSLQLQETIQSRHEDREDYWMPTTTLGHAPEYAVWAGIAQPTIGFHQDQWLQPTSDQYPPASTQQLPPAQLAYPAPLLQNPQHMACVNCPSIWCFHLESIMFSDPEDKGISNLKRSYRDLRQHIHEAHQWHYGASCALCENLFCYHLDKMIHLEVATGDLPEVKTDLRNSFKALRDHIKEAHGGC